MADSHKPRTPKQNIQLSTPEAPQHHNTSLPKLYQLAYADLIQTSASIGKEIEDHTDLKGSPQHQHMFHDERVLTSYHRA